MKESREEPQEKEVWIQQQTNSRRLFRSPIYFINPSASSLRVSLKGRARKFMSMGSSSKGISKDDVWLPNLRWPGTVFSSHMFMSWRSTSLLSTGTWHSMALITFATSGDFCLTIFLSIGLSTYLSVICYITFPLKLSMFYTVIQQHRSEKSAWQQAPDSGAHAIRALSRIKRRLEIP